MNSIRLILLFPYIIIFLFVSSFAHDGPVHQYIVKQAYYFLENEKGPIPELRDRIGLSFDGAGNDDNPWATGYIGVAAEREDLEDPIWGFGGFFNGWTPTVTHFWDADNGDDVKIPIPASPDAYNAFYKAKIYLFGGHNILYKTFTYDADLGQIIFGRIYSYNSIIELYKTGHCYWEGYVDLSDHAHYWTPIELYMDLESARKMAVQILGRVAHLLADMSVPAHTHNDLHFDINGKLQVTGDGYEDWMAKHYSEGFIEQPYINPIYWNALNAARQGPLVDVYQAVHTGDQSRSIRYLFYTMNQIADRFPSNDNSGDNVYSTNYNGDDYSILNIIQQITHPYNAGSVQPYDVNKYAFRYCIRAVAGLFYWFATQTGMLRVQVPIYVTKQFEFDQIESQSQSGYIAESLTISTPSVISKNNKNYTFAGWSDGNSSNPRTVTPIGSETYTAFYKVVHKSNDPAAFTNNSQRKIVRTRDNWLHMVYESMGRVWLEHSTDNGTTWFLGNNGKPLDNGEGKCPSIDWHYYQGLPNDPTFNSIIVVFQQKLSTTNTYTIEYAIFRYTNSSYIRVTPSNSVLLYTEPAGGDLYASVNANPNIAWGTGGGSTMPFVLCFERKSTAQGMQPGIYWRYGYMCEGGIINNPSPVNPVLIPGTTSNSINATVMLNKQCANNPNFDIVYEQYVSASSGSIKDAILYCRYDGTSWLPSTTQVVTLSSSTGVSNYKPSMVQMPDNNIRVCWIRSVNGQPQNSPFDVNVVYWNSAVYPARYSIYGWRPESVSINLQDDNTRSFYLFSQYSMYNQWENYISNGSSYIKLSTAGKNVQLSNGSGTNMFMSVFYPFSQPYYFQNAGMVPTSLQKTASNQLITYGRGAVLEKGDVQFYYSLKSLAVDDKNIRFIDVPENEADSSKTVSQTRREDNKYYSLDNLNTILLSEPFTIKSSSNIAFTDQAGFMDTLAVKSALSVNDYIACRLELVDYITGQVIGTIKESSFSSKEIPSGNLSSYRLATGLTGDKTVRLRITLSSNLTDIKGVLMNEYGTVDQEFLAKSSYNELKLDAPGIVKEYGLSQNYPNPFNPVTTIKYQLPKDGYVTIKIYDILGKEVKTLVKEYKTQGGYTAEFNASGLASGTYIYELRVNDYTLVKKMMVLK